MPVRSSTRSAPSLRTVSMVLAVVGVLLVASCGQQEPNEYNAKVKRSFVQGCTGQAQTDSGAADTSGTNGSGAGGAVKLGNQQSCECVYAGLVKNVPIKDFKKANSDLQENPNQVLPKVIAAQVQACEGSSGSSTSTTSTDSTSSS